MTDYMDELRKAVNEARKAADGDSNDNEIAALQYALDLALERIPEWRPIKHLTISMRFQLVDEELLRSHIALDGPGAHVIDDPSDPAQIAAEVMILGNPGVKAFLDYGVELLSTETWTD